LFAFPYTALVQYVLFKKVPWLMPFDNWLNRTFVVWATSMLLMVAVSLIALVPGAERIRGFFLSWKADVDSWKRDRTIVERLRVWPTSVFLLALVSLFTPPDAGRIRGIIWSWKAAAMPESERQRNRGPRSVFLWWSVFIGIMAVLYAYVIWFQFWGPGRGD
jgi:hypothetical protein